MSFDEPPCDPDGEEADIRTFYGIVDALKPLSDALHETIGTIMDCGTVATMAAERIASLDVEYDSARKLLARFAERESLVGDWRVPPEATNWFAEKPERRQWSTP